MNVSLMFVFSGDFLFETGLLRDILQFQETRDNRTWVVSTEPFQRSLDELKAVEP